MDWISFFNDSFWGSLDMIKSLALILFPLLIGVEIVDELGILDKFSKLFTPVLKYFKLSRHASLPLIVAQVFGITYGAGVILRSVEEDKLRSSELMTLAIFIVICHAVVEDTLLFAAIGGNALIILGARLLLAILITYLYTQYFVEDDNVNVEALVDSECC